MIIQAVGKRTVTFVRDIGNITSLTSKTITLIITFRGKWRHTMAQLYHLGAKSIPVVGITAIFVGMAFSIQVVREFLRFGAAELIGGVVGLAIWRELGPLLTGVVFAGRVGAAISAELGTMKVTEQVEALESMSQDITEYLVIPRVLACTIMLPLLVGLADILGFLGGFIIAVLQGQINPGGYIESAANMLRTIDIYGGLIKAALFGFSTAIISCYMGLKAKGGAKGVGEMTTLAVVVSLIVIFLLNFLMSSVFFAR